MAACNVRHVSWSAEKNISKQTTHKLSDTHLEFHLLSLLGVDGHDMLVMRERVSAVLLLGSHVALQGLQHTLRLDHPVEERIESDRDKPQ